MSFINDALRNPLTSPSQKEFLQRMQNQEYQDSIKGNPVNPELGYIDQIQVDTPERQEIYDRQEHRKNIMTKPKYPELGYVDQAIINTPEKEQMYEDQQYRDSIRYPDPIDLPYIDQALIGSHLDKLAEQDANPKVKPETPLPTQPLKPWKEIAPRPEFESSYPIAPHVPRSPVQRAEVNMGHIQQMMNTYGPGEGQTVLSKALRAGASPVPGQSGEYNG